MAAQLAPAQSARLQLAVSINATPDTVWNTIINQPDAWWIRELRCVPGPSRIRLDPVAGGTMVEEGTEGGSLLWFTVIAAEPGRSLNLAGAIAPPFGGPASAYLHLQLNANDDGTTTVEITNSMVGAVNEAMLSQTEEGWRMLFENGLKRFIETGTPV